MKYDPRDANQCIPAGTYPATIKSVSDLDKDGRPLVAKSGEAMQLVVFEVYVSNDAARLHFQRFTAKSMLFLYRALAHALGKADEFSDGKFDAKNYIGDNLRLELEVKSDKQFGDQNRIVEFMSAVPSGSAHASVQDSDVPF
jgi:hypothetical protein